MTQAAYLKRMKKHEESFDKIWRKIADDTNKFIDDNPNKNLSENRQIESFVDSMALSAGWIVDRLNKKYWKQNRGTLTSKMRKILGYTIN